MGTDSIVVARLLDYFTQQSPWHRSLWNPGTWLTLKELLEASEARRAGVLSEDALKSLGSACIRMSAKDPGAGNENQKKALQQALNEPLRYDGLKYHTIRELTDDIRSHYLKRWAEVLGQRDEQPRPERAARCIAAHLLDLGFASDYLHRWWTYHSKYSPQRITLVELLEELDGLARLPAKEYQVLVILKTLPAFETRGLPEWRVPTTVIQWLRNNGSCTQGIRPAGGLLLSVRALDPIGACVRAAEIVENFQARAAIGASAIVEIMDKVWISGQTNPVQVRGLRRGVRVRALHRESQIVLQGSEQSGIDASIELLANLERSSPTAAVASGWAAIEALLSEPDDRGGAAERLAMLVACSFPRAELTFLSYKLEKSDQEMAIRLSGVSENRTRSLLVAEEIQRGRNLTLTEVSDQAALERMRKLLSQPQDVLSDIRSHVADSFRRLYRQRNLILHWGKTDSVALRASLRTAAPLVGAGMDRIAHAWYAEKTRPLELAARASISLATVRSNDPSSCVSLLDGRD